MIIISAVDLVYDFLIYKNYLNVICYDIGVSSTDIIFITSTGGNTIRFIDGDNCRINETYINIVIRNSDLKTAKDLGEELISLFEKNTIESCISNKPIKNDPIYIGKEETTTGNFYLFGIDLIVKYSSSNN